MTEQWLQRPEGGNLFGLRLIRGVALKLGRGPVRLLLYPITLYFLLRRPPERRASRAYLQRVLGRHASLRDVIRHLHCFAGVTLDRVFLLSERFRRFDIRTAGLRELDGALEQGRGVLLFGAHLGSFEALRVLSEQRPEVPVRIVLDVEQGPALSAVLNALNPKLAATIINARRGGPAMAIAIKEALDRNAIVAVLVDRARPGNAVSSAHFLGGIARFPIAPWQLAATVHVPVILAFGLYRGGNRYELHFELFSDGLRIDRSRRQAQLSEQVQRFADRLAHYVRLAPYNWFNFYDFWQGEEAWADTGSAAPSAADSLVRRS